MLSILRNTLTRSKCGSRSVSNLTKKCELPPPKSVVRTGPACKCVDNKRELFCNVTVLGADSNIGEMVSYLLKQNPLVTGLHVEGSDLVVGMEEDLKSIDTGCRVSYHTGADHFRNALKTADIVVLLGRDNYSKQTSLGDRVMVEGERVCRLAQYCTKYSPRAVILVCVRPAAIMVPLVSEIFKLTHWYHPSRIIGYTSCIPLLVNTAVAKHQCFDPYIVDVPLAGGPDLDCVVPVFSRASPCPLDEHVAIRLLAELRGIDHNDFPHSTKPANTILKCTFPEAIAINRLVSSVALGLLGDETSVTCVHVRCSVIETCRYLTTQVRFGRGGIVHNYGISPLSYFEQDILERSTALINEKEIIAKEYLEYYLSQKKDTLPQFKQKEIDDCCKFQDVNRN